MRPVRVTVSSLTSSAVIPLDHYASTSTVALGCAISSGAVLTYKVEHTFDDVFSPTFSAATATWYDHATIVGKTTSADGNYAYPPTACRLTVTAYTSGSVTLTVNQVGIA